MNKKFILVSLSIFLTITILFGLSKVVFGDKITFSDAIEFYDDKPIIEYVGNEKTEEGYNVTISIKNTLNSIMTINDLELNLLNDIYIKGINEEIFANGNIKYGIDGGEVVEYVFKIPNGIKFDKKIFDINEMHISYNVTMYKYRTSRNSLMIPTGSVGGGTIITGDLDSSLFQY